MAGLVFMCLKTADVRGEDVWGIMLTWRGRSLVHVHTARALFFIILIILKAKLIFLIYLISTPRLRADLRADFREFIFIY